MKLVFTLFYCSVSRCCLKKFRGCIMNDFFWFYVQFSIAKWQIQSFYWKSKTWTSLTYFSFCPSFVKNKILIFMIIIWNKGKFWQLKWFAREPGWPVQQPPDLSAGKVRMIASASTLIIEINSSDFPTTFRDSRKTANGTTGNDLASGVLINSPSCSGPVERDTNNMRTLAEVGCRLTTSHACGS